MYCILRPMTFGITEMNSINISFCVQRKKKKDFFSRILIFAVHWYDPRRSIHEEAGVKQPVCLYMSFLRKLLLFPAVFFHMKKHSYPPAAWPLLNLWRPVMTVPMNLHRLYHKGSCCRMTVTPMAAENIGTYCKRWTVSKITAALAFSSCPSPLSCKDQ